VHARALEKTSQEAGLEEEWNSFSGYKNSNDFLVNFLNAYTRERDIFFK